MPFSELEIQQITKKLGLKIGFIEDGILLKSSITAFNKETAGLYLIAIISMVVFCLVVTSEFSALMLVGSVLFGTVLIISIATIFKTYLDYLKISSHHIEFRNNFKLHRVEKSEVKKVKIKFENGTISRKNRTNSEYKYRRADIFVKTTQGKLRVIEFTADRKLSKDVDALAQWIKTQVLA